MHPHLWFSLFVLIAFPIDTTAQPPRLPPPDGEVVPLPSVPTEELIPVLIAALADEDLTVRLNVAIALAGVGSEAVPALIAALKDPNADRRGAAAYALGQMGVSAEPAMPALLMVLKDEEAEVRRRASYAVSRIIIAAKRASRIRSVPEVPPVKPIPFAGPELGDPR